MNLIARLLGSNDIVVALDATSKKRLFEEVARHFEKQFGIAKDVVFDALVAREKMGSTGLGLGIAIPHGRIKGLKEARGAFFRLTTPVPFDAPDGQPVNLVFVLLVPEAASERHLQLLSELAQMFSDKSFRERLATAADAAAVHSLFEQWQSGN